MQTKPRHQADPCFDQLEQLKIRGNAARNEMVELTVTLRNYADELREYCRAHCHGRRSF